MANYTISKIQLPNGDICNIKDTTYENKTASSGSDEVSLVTRDEKYQWDSKANAATTLSGYGITDATIANGTITLGSNTITPLTASSTLNAARLSGKIPTECHPDVLKKITITNDAGANDDININRNNLTGKVTFGSGDNNFGLYDVNNSNWIIYRNFSSGLSYLSTLGNDISIQKTDPIFTFYNENVTRGVTPSANYKSSINFKSKQSDNKLLGIIDSMYQSDGMIRMELLTLTPVTTTDAVYRGIRLFHTSSNVSRADFDVSKLSTNGVWDTDIILNKQTTEDNATIRAIAGGREIWLYSNNKSSTTARGIWLPPTGTGAGKSVITVDDNNNIYYNSGKMNGDFWIQPTTSTNNIYAGIRNASGALYFWQSGSSTGNKGIYMAAANDTNTSDDLPLVEINQDNRIYRWANFQIGAQAATNFIYNNLSITKNNHTGPTNVTYPSNWRLLDNNNQVVTSLEARIYPASGNANSSNDGRVDAYWYVRNEYEDSTFDTLGISMNIRTSGDKWYSIASPELFKEALSLGNRNIDFEVLNNSGTTQHWGISGRVVGSGKAFEGYKTGLVMCDDGLYFYERPTANSISGKPTGDSIGIWSFNMTGGGLYFYKNQTHAEAGNSARAQKYAYKALLLVGEDVYNGTDSDTSSRSIYAASNSGRVCLYSTGNTNGDGSRGIWAAKHGNNGQAHTVLAIDTNNQSRINLMRNTDSFINLYRYDVSRGTAPEANKYWSINFWDSNSTSKRLGLIDAHYNTNGAVSVEMMTQTPVANTDNDVYRGVMVTQYADATSTIDLRADEIKAAGILYPTSTNYNLGTSTNGWNILYCKQILGTGGSQGFFGFGSTINGWGGISNNTSQVFGHTNYTTYIRSSGKLYHFHHSQAYSIYDTNNIIYSTTAPSTRNDGTALQTGDIWLQPV